MIGGCTDPAWNSVNCFPHCKASLLGGISTVYRCSDDSWCCADGGNTTSCCNDPQVKLFKIIKEAHVENGTAFAQGYNIAPDDDITGTAVPSSAPSNTSSCAVTTVTTTARSSSNVSATDLGVGLGVGIPLLAAVGILSFLLLREKKRSRPAGTRRGSASSMGPMVARPSVHAVSQRTEVSSPQVESPRTGFGEPPLSAHFAEAGAEQRRNVHELDSKEPQLVAELPGLKS